MMCQLKFPRALLPEGVVRFGASGGDVGAVRGRAGSEVGRRRELLAVEAAHIAASLAVIVLEVTNAAGDRQRVRDQVEIDRGELRQLLVAALDVVEEPRRRVRGDRRASPATAGAARSSRTLSPVGRAGRNGHVRPLGLVDDLVILPVRADEAADAPVVRGAQAQLVALVRVASRVPSTPCSACSTCRSRDSFE